MSDNRPIDINAINASLDTDVNEMLTRTMQESETQAREIISADNIKAKLIVLAGTVIVPVAISIFVATVSPQIHTTWFIVGLATYLGIEAWLTKRIIRSQAPRASFFIIKDLHETSQILRDGILRHQEQYKQMRRKLTTLDSTVEALSNGMAQSLIRLESYISAAVPSDNASFKNILADIMDPMTSKAHHLFELSAQAQVVFTVYLFNPKSQLLEVVFRHDPKKVAKEFRKWKRHQGFAGTIFSNKATMIVPNIIKNGKSNEFEIKGPDKEKFRAAIGVPIIATSDGLDTEKDPIGVIVVTSSTADQFADKEGKDNRFESILFSTSKLVSIFIDNIEREIDNENLPSILYGDE